MDRATDAGPERLPAGYELVETFADGVLYGVRREGAEGPLALTLLPQDAAADAARFGRLEAARRAASAAAHDGLARVVDLGRDGNRAYVVEAVLGVPLVRRLRENGALPVRDALEIAHQVASVLAHAHAAGLVHGAVAPTTIWVDPDRRTVLAGLLAGVAGLEDGRYLAPERLAGGAPDALGDVFALGLVLYEMVEGRAFLDGPAESIRERLLETKGPLLPRFSRIPPAGFAGLVARMIRRKASERPSAAAVREEIARCLGRLPARGGAAGVVIDADLAPELDDDERPASPAPRPRLRAGGLSTFWRSAFVAETALLAAAVFALGWVALRDGRAPSLPPTPVAPPMPAVVLAPQAPQAPPADAAPVAENVAVAADAGPAAVASSAPPPNHGPRIVSRLPRATAPVDVTEGTAVEFSVRSDDPDDGDVITYAWRVDGRAVGSGMRFRFVAPPAATATVHAIEVTAADRAGVRSRPVSWDVAVAPRMSEANVRDWLQRYASAWQHGDVATLRLYGIVTDDAAREALRRRVRRAHDRRVAITNETIQTSGRYAQVVFDRVELDAEKPVESVHESLSLEKRADGFVALRQPAGTSLAQTSR